MSSLRALSVLTRVDNPLDALSSSRENELWLHAIAILIGVIAGLGAVVFRLAIYAAQEVFWGDAFNPGAVEFSLVPVPNLFALVSGLGGLGIVLLPAVGGLLVGLVVHFTTDAVKGHGVPKVLESMFVPGSTIDPKVAIYKTVASSIAIGSGGSLGREGPIVQIGSAAGSFFSRFLEDKYARTLVAAGAAAGIAGTFNAPLGGVMFALEILLAEYYLQNVVAVVLASVTATAVARPILEFTPNPGVGEFLVPIHYQMVAPAVEFPLYVVLGLLAAVAGAAVVKFLYATEHAFERLDAPGWLKPALGGGLLGLTVLFAALTLHASMLQAAAWLLGVGYGAIRESILGHLGITVLVALAVLKTVGFSLSVGSGSSGGVFSPALFVGAMVGGAFGFVAHGALPATTATPGAYALVGMAGLFAAAASAPLTATLIIFELTGQYTVILPLLVVCVTASFGTQRLLNRGTIYTEKLRDKGITAQERRIGSLEDLCASDVMTTDVDTLPTDATVEDALKAFQRTKHNGLPIVDEAGTLEGIVTLTDLEAELANSVVHYLDDDVSFELERESQRSALDIATTDVSAVLPGTNLLLVVDLMESSDVGRIPVVDEDKRLVGIITRSDVLDAYDNLPSGIKPETAGDPSLAG